MWAMRLERPQCVGVSSARCAPLDIKFVILKSLEYDDRHVLSWFPRRERSSRQLRLKIPLSELVEVPVEIAVPMTPGERCVSP
jgi:hypothetical protein